MRRVENKIIQELKDYKTHSSRFNRKERRMDGRGIGRRDGEVKKR